MRRAGSVCGLLEGKGMNKEEEVEGLLEEQKPIAREEVTVTVMLLLSTSLLTKSISKPTRVKSSFLRQSSTWLIA